MVKQNKGVLFFSHSDNYPKNSFSFIIKGQNLFKNPLKKNIYEIVLLQIKNEKLIRKNKYEK
jgi:hypothetical protein